MVSGWGILIVFSDSKGHVCDIRMGDTNSVFGFRGSLLWYQDGVYQLCFRIPRVTFVVPGWCILTVFSDSKGHFCGIRMGYTNCDFGFQGSLLWYQDGVY